VIADRQVVLTARCDLPRARDKRISAGNDLFADRRPELYAERPAPADARVAAARAHWALRFVANGTEFADFEATLARITRWDDWCREWGVTAQHYEAVAAAAGQGLTAGEAWRRAALCWHWGKFVFTDHPDEQRFAHDRAVACYRRGADSLSPPASLVAVPYGDRSLAAYLRIPFEGAPVVIMIPGLDSVKEELQATAEYLLRRGLAVIAVDGPGQGEAEFAGLTPGQGLPIEPAYERVVDAVAGFLRGRAEVDADRIAVFGVSLGGYYAARAAGSSAGPLRAAVALAGPYRFDLDWDSLPPQTRATFQARSGASSPDQARERAGALTLESAASRIRIPMLVVHGGQDRLVPAYHAERLAAEAPGAELLLFPDGNHGVTNHAFESRSRIADWLAGHLGTGADNG
jgi:2,6-dihydroxypseudooxynicotine hydrolase